GPLDDDAAGLQGAAGLGVLDDAPGRTVLDRPAGIEEFGLAENGAAGQLRRPFQLDERGVADGFDEVISDLHDELLRLQEFAETIRPLGRRSSARSTFFAVAPTALYFCVLPQLRLPPRHRGTRLSWPSRSTTSCRSIRLKPTNCLALRSSATSIAA